MKRLPDWVTASGIVAVGFAGVVVVSVGIMTFADYLSTQARKQSTDTAMRRCHEAVVQGLEHETKWSDYFGCIAKHGERWEPTKW